MTRGLFGDREADALRSALLAMEGAKLTRRVQAAAFGVSGPTISRWCGLLGVEKEDPFSFDDLPGEEWRPLAGYSVRVSNMGRVSSIQGRLLKPFVRGGRNPVYSIVSTDKSVRKTAHLSGLMDAVGWTVLDRAETWSSSEDAVIRLSKTFPEAASRLPNRTADAIRARRKKLKVRWKSARHKAPPVVKSWGNALLSEASAVIPRGTPEDVRQDLVNDIVVMFLEGFDGSMTDAFKKARTKRNLLFGAFKERSAFDVIGGTEDLRLIDTFASDQERF